MATLTKSLPHGMESKIVLDSRLHFVYSGFQSLSVELGFRISMFRGIPYSLSRIPDSKAQDSGPNRQKSFGFWIPQAKISWILESDSLIWCVSLA